MHRVPGAETDSFARPRAERRRVASLAQKLRIARQAGERQERLLQQQRQSEVQQRDEYLCNCGSMAACCGELCPDVRCGGPPLKPLSYWMSGLLLTVWQLAVVGFGAWGSRLCPRAHVQLCMRDSCSGPKGPKAGLQLQSFKASRERGPAAGPGSLQRSDQCCRGAVAVCLGCMVGCSACTKTCSEQAGHRRAQKDIV